MTDKNSTALVPLTWSDAKEMSKTLATCSVISSDLRNAPANVLATIMAGAELGIPPMTALRSIHIIKGRPVLSASLMVGLVLASGKAEYFVRKESSATSATYETKRFGAPAQSMTFTIEDAIAAQLTAGGRRKEGARSDGGNWEKYPQRMLEARAKAALARDVYPDVLEGCYTEDEARDFSEPEFAPPPPVAVVTDAVIVEDEAVSPEEALMNELTDNEHDQITLMDIGKRAADTIAKGHSLYGAFRQCWAEKKAELVEQGLWS